MKYLQAVLAACACGPLGAAPPVEQPPASLRQALRPAPGSLRQTLQEVPAPGQTPIRQLSPEGRAQLRQQLADFDQPRRGRR